MDTNDFTATRTTDSDGTVTVTVSHPATGWTAERSGSVAAKAVAVIVTDSGEGDTDRFGTAGFRSDADKAAKEATRLTARPNFHAVAGVVLIDG